MDLGLDRLVAMIEERFGKKASTALLVLVYMGVAAAMMGLVLSNVIGPIYDLASGIHSGRDVGPAVFDFARRILIAIVIGVAAGLVLLSLGSSVIQFLLKRAERSVKEISTEADETLALARGVLAEAVAVKDAAGANVETTTQQIQTASSLLKRLERALDAAEGGSPLK